MTGAIRITRTSAAVVVSVESDLDQKVALELHELLQDLIVSQDRPTILIDVASLDGAGILGTAVLAGAKAIALERGSQLTFSSSCPQVATALRHLEKHQDLTAS